MNGASCGGPSGCAKAITPGWRRSLCGQGVCAAQISPPASATPPAATAVPAATAAPAGESDRTPANPGQIDVFAGVLSDQQRKMLDRDPRCGDASSAAGAFVASSGKALQTGVDAMSALEKCAVLPRVGSDWGDFRDYVITAAAALAYAVGNAANDARLLRRAADDASHVSGFDAANVTVTTYVREARCRKRTTPRATG